MRSIYKKIREWWKPIGCRVYTDEGIFGDGESGLSPKNGRLEVTESPGIGNEWLETFIQTCDREII